MLHIFRKSEPESDPTPEDRARESLKALIEQSNPNPDLLAGLLRDAGAPEELLERLDRIRFTRDRSSAGMQDLVPDIRKVAEGGAA